MLARVGAPAVFKGLQPDRREANFAVELNDMTLDTELFRVILSHPCPHCGHKLQNKGSWFAAALRVPEVKAKLALQGLYPVGMCGAEFADYTRQRYDEYGKAISAAGLKPQ